MSVEQRRIDHEQLRVRKSRSRYASKRFYPSDKDLASSLEAVWAVFDSESFLQEYMYMSAFEGVFPDKRTEESDTVLDDLQFAERWPILCSLLTATPVIQGKRRRVATMTWVCEDGVAKAGIKDRDHDLSLWVSSTSILGCLEALEEALTERPVRWRRVTDDRYRKGGSK